MTPADARAMLRDRFAFRLPQGDGTRHHAGDPDVSAVSEISQVRKVSSPS
ncbi:hypothetical protein [Nonomuraea sp. SYSU D8015]|nr:hypothetical protein [Nonomuraea sp. SYSU D8015]